MACLSTESAEGMYVLGEARRVVGISGFNSLARACGDSAELAAGCKNYSGLGRDSC